MTELLFYIFSIENITKRTKVTSSVKLYSKKTIHNIRLAQRILTVFLISIRLNEQFQLQKVINALL